jgi:hypothetical protein
MNRNLGFRPLHNKRIRLTSISLVAGSREGSLAETDSQTVTLFQVITPAESLSEPSAVFDPLPQQPGDQDTPSARHRQYLHCLLAHSQFTLLSVAICVHCFVIAWQLCRPVWSGSTVRCAKPAAYRLLHIHLHSPLIAVKKASCCAVLRMRKFRTGHLQHLTIQARYV